jgi:hypothetical protein
MKNGFSVSEELSGHGIGEEFHCLPLVLHHSKFFFFCIRKKKVILLFKHHDSE